MFLQNNCGETEPKVPLHNNEQGRVCVFILMQFVQSHVKRPT